MHWCSRRKLTEAKSPAETPQIRFTYNPLLAAPLPFQHANTHAFTPRTVSRLRFPDGLCDPILSPEMVACLHRMLPTRWRAPVETRTGVDALLPTDRDTEAAGVASVRRGWRCLVQTQPVPAGSCWFQLVPQQAHPQGPAEPVSQAGGTSGKKYLRKSKNTRWAEEWGGKK